MTDVDARGGAVVLAVVGAVGCAALAVAHAGVEVPLLSALGPGGSQPVWPAAVAFSAATLAYAAVAAGLQAGAAWAWWAGMALFAVTVVGALQPFRGVGSLAGIVLGVLGLVLLALPSARGLRRAPRRARVGD